MALHSAPGLGSEPTPLADGQDSNAGDSEFPDASSLLGWKTFALLLAFGGLALSLIASVEWSFQRAASSVMEMERRERLGDATQHVLQRLVDAETAQRGFLLTGREIYLEPFANAEADVFFAVAQLRVHYAAMPELLTLVDKVSTAAQAKLAELKQTTQWHREGKRDQWGALLNTDLGKRTMDSARGAVAELVKHAGADARQQQADVSKTLKLGRATVHIITLLSIAWLVYFVRSNMALRRAQLRHAQQMKRERDLLDGRVKQRTRELADLTLHVQTTRDAERGRFARSLHDELGATLTAAKLQVTRIRRAPDPLPAKALERLEHLATLLDESISIKRRVIEELMPSSLHNLGLRPALELLCDEFRAASGTAVHFEMGDMEPSEPCRNAVFQLLQAALDNIAQHAKAQQVWVHLTRQGNRVQVQVRDDGVGFSLAEWRAQRFHSAAGLNRMRNRIELADGVFEVGSKPGLGTELNATLPL